MQLTIDIPGLAGTLAPHLRHPLLHTSRDTHNYDQLAVLAASLDSANFAVEHFQDAKRYPASRAGGPCA
jgi:hypothetical protein